MSKFSRSTDPFEKSQEIESYEGFNDETGTPIFWYVVKSKN